ncbi:MAG: DNA-3-methyladenine glycosylase family protein [Candidatus Thorarchaeota archaeon]
MAPFSYEEDNKQLRYITQLRSNRVLDLRICEIPEGVQVDITGSLNPDEKKEIRAQVTWMLGLDSDFSEFYALAKKEPKLAQMKKKAQGRALRSPTLFEDVIKTILTTNTLWGATKRMNQNLIKQFGSPLEEDPEQRAFPSPKQIASTSESVLRQETRLGYRAPYVLELAQSIASGKTDLELLKDPTIPTEKLRKALLEIKGVGNYATANLLNILGRYDFLPIDTWALKVVSYEWYDGQSIGPKEVEAAFEKWGKWRGMAYWFWNWAYYHKDSDS